jgi:hypothetical protein
MQPANGFEVFKFPGHNKTLLWTVLEAPDSNFSRVTGYSEILISFLCEAWKSAWTTAPGYHNLLHEFQKILAIAIINLSLFTVSDRRLIFQTCQFRTVDVFSSSAEKLLRFRMGWFWWNCVISVDWTAEVFAAKCVSIRLRRAMTALVSHVMLLPTFLVKINESPIDRFRNVVENLDY